MKTKPSVYKDHTLKNAKRKCGHREDYSTRTSWHTEERTLADYAYSTDCTACKEAQRLAREAEDKVYLDKAKEYLAARNIDLNDVRFEVNAHAKQVRVDFYLAFND